MFVKYLNLEYFLEISLLSTEDCLFDYYLPAQLQRHRTNQHLWLDSQSCSLEVINAFLLSYWVDSLRKKINYGLLFAKMIKSLPRLTSK